MTEPRVGLPSFWSTTIAKVLVGDQPCYLQPWLQARFKFDKSQRDESSLAQWKADHTALLASTVDKFKADGWKCQVERFFRVTGQFAILSGKADLIIQKADKRPCIVDTKSGTPRDSDIAQVLIEMIAVPMAWESPSMIFEGAVVYPTHTVRIPPADADRLKPRLFALLKKLGTMARPAASPSQSSCRFCEVPDSECLERFKEAEAPVLTNEF